MLKSDRPGCEAGGKFLNPRREFRLNFAVWQGRLFALAAGVRAGACAPALPFWLLDAVPVLPLDAPYVLLPFGVEAVPGLDEVGVEFGQEVRAIQDEGGGDALAGRGAA